MRRVWHRRRDARRRLPTCHAGDLEARDLEPDRGHPRRDTRRPPPPRTQRRRANGPRRLHDVSQPFFKLASPDRGRRGVMGRTYELVIYGAGYVVDQATGRCVGTFEVRRVPPVSTEGSVRDAAASGGVGSAARGAASKPHFDQGPRAPHVGSGPSPAVSDELRKLEHRVWRLEGLVLGGAAVVDPSEQPSERRASLASRLVDEGKS